MVTLTDLLDLDDADADGHEHWDPSGVRPALATQDPAGARCPFHAHIRKTFLRGLETPHGGQA